MGETVSAEPGLFHMWLAACIFHLRTALNLALHLPVRLRYGAPAAGAFAL